MENKQLTQRQVESTVIDSPIQKIWEKVSKLRLDLLLPRKVHKVEYVKGNQGQIESQVKLTFNDQSEWVVQIQEISEQEHKIVYELVSPSDIANTIELKEITDVNSTYLKWSTFYSSEVGQDRIMDAKYKKLDYFQDLKRRKILFVMTSNDIIPKLNSQTGYYYPEVAIVYEYLKEKGYDIVLASPKGGRAPCDERSFIKFNEDPICKKWTQNQETQELFGQSLQAKDVNVDEFICVYYPGGKGPMFDLFSDEEFHTIGSRIYENGGIVGALCHGPAAILNMKLKNGEYLVKGKQTTCFSNIEESMADVMPFCLEDTLKERGGIYQQKTEKFQSFVVSDQRLVTGQNPTSTQEFAEALHIEIQKLN